MIFKYFIDNALRELKAMVESLYSFKFLFPVRI